MQIHPAGTEVKTRIGRFTVKVPMYKINIIVEVGDVRKIVKKWTNTDDEENDYYDGIVLEVGFNTCPIVVFSEDVSAGVVVHECVHLSHRIFKHISHVPSLNEDEPHAYLIEWLFNSIWPRVEKAKSKFCI